MIEDSRSARINHLIDCLDANGLMTDQNVNLVVIDIDLRLPIRCLSVVLHADLSAKSPVKLLAIS